MDVSLMLHFSANQCGVGKWFHRNKRYKTYRFRIMIMFLLGWGTAAFASRLCLLFLWIQASAHWEDGERLAAGLALADDDVNSRGR